jgi:hypothetical protein
MNLSIKFPNLKKHMYVLRHPLIWALMFNLFMIMGFFGLYMIYRDDFEFRDSQSKNSKRQRTAFDLLLLSTTVQAGVGVTSIYPKTDIASGLLILQQFIMISGNILAFYINSSLN